MVIEPANGFRAVSRPSVIAASAFRASANPEAVASTQPWTRYEFADPQLEALPAGSKMLLRMGSENAQRLKAKLRTFRSAIASAAAKN